MDDAVADEALLEPCRREEAQIRRVDPEGQEGGERKRRGGRGLRARKRVREEEAEEGAMEGRPSNSFSTFFLHSSMASPMLPL